MIFNDNTADRGSALWSLSIKSSISPLVEVDISPRGSVPFGSSTPYSTNVLFQFSPLWWRGKQMSPYLFERYDQCYLQKYPVGRHICQWCFLWNRFNPFSYIVLSLHMYNHLYCNDLITDAFVWLEIKGEFSRVWGRWRWKVKKKWPRDHR